MGVELHRKSICFLILLFACHSLFSQTNTYKNEVKPDSYSTKIFSNPDNSYGYDILKENKVLIHQQNIPGQTGLKGFLKRDDAKKVALLVTEKLSQGIMPPTIETKELIQLKIKF